MYILGNVNQFKETNWNPTQGVAMNYNSETQKFTATVYCQNSINYFAFATELNSWDSLNADGAQKRFGSENGAWDANEDLSSHLDTPVAIRQGSQSSFALPAGVFSFTLDVPNLKLTVSKKPLQVTTYPVQESVKQGQVISATSNLTAYVAATGSGETVTVQVKKGSEYKDTVMLAPGVTKVLLTANFPLDSRIFKLKNLTGVNAKGQIIVALDSAGEPVPFDFNIRHDIPHEELVALEDNVRQSVLNSILNDWVGAILPEDK